MVGLVMPIAIVISLHSYELLMLWTRNADIAGEAAPIASILVLGTAMNGIMNLPFAIQLASGWMRMALSLVVALIVIIVPLSIVLTAQLGGIGCAIAWFMLNALYLLAGSHATHRQLPAELVQMWFFRNVLPGVLAASVVVVAFRLIYSGRAGAVQEVMMICIVTALAVLAACFAGAESRRWILARLANIQVTKNA
jgi:hypothetical protein